MADVLGRGREDTNDGGKLAGNVRDAVELGRRLGWSEKVGCLLTDAAEGSSSSSLSISKCVMLAAALFFGRDLWVRGGSEEKDSGADCGADCGAETSEEIESLQWWDFQQVVLWKNFAHTVQGMGQALPVKFFKHPPHFFTGFAGSAP